MDNDTCWNYSRNGKSGRLRKTVKEENSSMIYWIYCKNISKCHNVPQPSTTTKKRILKKWCHVTSKLSNKENVSATCDILSLVSITYSEQSQPPYSKLYYGKIHITRSWWLKNKPARTCGQPATIWVFLKANSFSTEP
jgi:hypothetical protein